MVSDGITEAQHDEDDDQEADDEDGGEGAKVGGFSEAPLDTFAPAKGLLPSSGNVFTEVGPLPGSAASRCPMSSSAEDMRS